MKKNPRENLFFFLQMHEHTPRARYANPTFILNLIQMCELYHAHLTEARDKNAAKDQYNNAIGKIFFTAMNTPFLATNNSKECMAFFYNCFTVHRKRIAQFHPQLLEHFESAAYKTRDANSLILLFKLKIQNVGSDKKPDLIGALTCLETAAQCTGKAAVSALFILASLHIFDLPGTTNSSLFTKMKDPIWNDNIYFSFTELIKKCSRALLCLSSCDAKKWVDEAKNHIRLTYFRDISEGDSCKKFQRSLGFLKKALLSAINEGWTGIIDDASVDELSEFVLFSQLYLKLSAQEIKQNNYAPRILLNKNKNATHLNFQDIAMELINALSTPNALDKMGNRLNLAFLAGELAKDSIIKSSNYPSRVSDLTLGMLAGSAICARNLRELANTHFNFLSESQIKPYNYIAKKQMLPKRQRYAERTYENEMLLANQGCLVSTYNLILHALHKNDYSQINVWLPLAITLHREGLFVQPSKILGSLSLLISHCEERVRANTSNDPIYTHITPWLFQLFSHETSTEIQSACFATLLKITKTYSNNELLFSSLSKLMMKRLACTYPDSGLIAELQAYAKQLLDEITHYTHASYDPADIQKVSHEKIDDNTSRHSTDNDTDQFSDSTSNKQLWSRQR